MLLLEEGEDSITSASINTLGKQEFLYGRIEVSAKIPSALGSWPAIWMLGTNHSEVGWPACGEIDIMEHVGYDPNLDPCQHPYPGLQPFHRDQQGQPD
jgi:beta-glucanase (GH16 family)